MPRLLLAEQESLDERLEGEIRGVEVCAHDRARNDDDHASREYLALVGPVDLPQLAPAFRDEASPSRGGGGPRRLGDRLSRLSRPGALRDPVARGGLGLLPAARPALLSRRTSHAYLVSRWVVWRRHQRQYFFSSIRSGVLRLDFIDW
jgi:hypothetical protein